MYYIHLENLVFNPNSLKGVNMSIKKQICSVFVFVFVFGIFFISIPSLSFAQTGCCSNNNNQQCTPGQSAATPDDCNSQETFIPDSFCTGAPHMCVENPPPGEGCCVESPGNCVVETEAACDGGDYKGDGTFCVNFPAECEGVPPEFIGCCIFPEFICTEDTGESCDQLGGNFQGDETQCSDFPESCIAPPAVRNIPTLSEMGVIVAAVLLGLISLVVVRKRFSHKTK